MLAKVTILQDIVYKFAIVDINLNLISFDDFFKQFRIFTLLVLVSNSRPSFIMGIVPCILINMATRIANAYLLALVDTIT